MTNIALLGKAGSGKTELAKSIEDTHVKLSFATPVKELSVELYNKTAEFLGVDSRANIEQFYSKTTKPYFRILMQVVGTEIGRQYFGEHVWVDALRPAIEYHIEHGNPIVVDDVRFTNEYTMLSSYGFKMVLINRPNIGDSKHSSENIPSESLEEMKRMGLTVIDNDGTLEELVEKFRQAIR